MRLMNVLWFLLVGVIAGWLAGVLVKGGGFGLIGDLVVGIIGALIGGLLFSGLSGAVGGGVLGSIVVATLGAMILLVVLRVIRRA
ncbi:transglycosylase associated family protein [Cyanobium sp. NS01]|nr:transglycosylase associated family protein [Cyanobium sp. NS01]